MPHSHLGLVCYYQTLDLTASAIQKDNLGEAGSVFCTSVRGRTDANAQYIYSVCVILHSEGK